MLQNSIFKFFLATITTAILVLLCIFIWRDQTPTIINITHKISPDRNNYPQNCYPIIGKVYINDAFEIIITIKNKGFLPINHAAVRITTSSNIEIDNKKMQILKNKKTVDVYRWSIEVPVETLERGETKQINLLMSSMAAGQELFEIETKNSLPPFSKTVHQYRMVFDSEKINDTAPSRPSSIYTFLQDRSRKFCNNLFLCLEKDNNGTCLKHTEYVDGFILHQFINFLLLPSVNREQKKSTIETINSMLELEKEEKILKRKGELKFTMNNIRLSNPYSLWYWVGLRYQGKPSRSQVGSTMGGSERANEFLSDLFKNLPDNYTVRTFKDTLNEEKLSQCYIHEQDVAYEGCPLNLPYSEEDVDAQIECLNRKHGFIFPKDCSQLNK